MRYFGLDGNASSMQAGAVLTASTHTGTLPPCASNWGTTAQGGAALTGNTQAGTLPKGARASASEAGRLGWLSSSRLTAMPLPVLKKPPRGGPAAF